MFVFERSRSPDAHRGFQRFFLKDASISSPQESQMLTGLPQSFFSISKREKSVVLPSVFGKRSFSTIRTR